jgi:hypothetical protein
MRIQDESPAYFVPHFLLGEYTGELEKPANQSGGKSAVTTVDIGSGYDQILEGAKEAYPSLPSRLVLQELTETIQEVNLKGERRDLGAETR